MRESELKKIKPVQEGLADLADKAEKDHEVQMARAELYKAAKYSIKLHEMLKGVSEAEGLEGWVQSKITKSADYLSSVFHHLDYQEASDEMPAIGEATQEATCGCSSDCGHCSGKHTMKEVGQICNCCGNKIKAVATEGKGKSNKQKAAIAIAKKKKGYKESLADKLTSKLKEAKETCKDCGKPSYTTLPEEKQKGVNGKVCWKGYKRMGTKKKGGKTVDNCVKM